MSGTEGSIVDTDIFHPAAFQAAGECQLLDGTTYSMSRMQELYLETLSQRKKDRLFPYGITGGVTLELWDFIDALSTGRAVEIDVEAKTVTVAGGDSSDIESAISAAGYAIA